MLGRIFTVGSYTLLSRLTGFARDIMLAAILGAGPVADAVFVAFRLAHSFPRDLCRGSVQRRLRAGLCSCPWREGRSFRKAVRRPHLHAVVPVAGDPAR